CGTGGKAGPRGRREAAVFAGAAACPLSPPTAGHTPAQPSGRGGCMCDASALPDWNALAGLDDAALPLLGTSLLIASDEYPHLDSAHYTGIIDQHVCHLRGTVEGVDHFALKMQ